MGQTQSNAERNRALLQSFVDRFPPDVKTFQGGMNINATDAINMQRVTDGYTATVYDRECGMGITAIVWGQQYFKAYVEVVQSPGDGIVCTSSAEDFRIAVCGVVFSHAFTAFGEFIHGKPASDPELGAKNDSGGENEDPPAAP